MIKQLLFIVQMQVIATFLWKLLSDDTYLGCNMPLTDVMIVESTKRNINNIRLG